MFWLVCTTRNNCIFWNKVNVYDTDSYIIIFMLYKWPAVILMENGDVYTFGYGQHGQLGHGDVNSRYQIKWKLWFLFWYCYWDCLAKYYFYFRGSPTLVQGLPAPCTQVTAGSNHTALLLADGQVFTFGSFSVRKLS